MLNVLLYDLLMVDTLDDVDDPNDIDSFLELSEKDQKRIESKPNIDDLEDAVIENPDGSYHFVPGVGMQVVIDRTSVMLPGNPWLDTRIYKVLDVNQTTGDLKLYNDDLRQHALSNFIEGKKNGFSFKIPAKKGVTGVKKRRGKRGIAPKKAHDKKPNEPKVPGLRRLYVVKGVLHTRLKGIAYGPATKSTASDPEDKVLLVVNANGAMVTCPEKNWEEQWEVLSI